MNLKESIDNLIQLAGIFESRNDISIYSLLKESGYFQFYNQIDEPAICDAVRNHPESVAQWMRYCEDKRTGESWYFRAVGNGFEVGHYPVLSKVHDPTYFADGNSAAAAFISREAEEIRKS